MPYKDIEKRKTFNREYQRKPEMKEKAKLRGKPNQKLNRIKWLYGLNEEDYLILVSETNGICKICLTTLIFKPKTGSSAVIDHCHKTNKVRGMICHNCNVMLANAKDDTSTLKRAIDYLSL